MKKLTLDETWRLCLSMWRWVAKQIRGGSRKCIDNLKIQWLEAHRYELNEEDDEYIKLNCFFCEYEEQQLMKGERSSCDYCPGKMIDKSFSCVGSGYSWSGTPIAFYNKLVSLNRKRLAKKGKRKGSEA